VFIPEKSSGPLRIFLSYGHDANEALVVRIRDDLKKRGHDVWFDKSEIKFGDDWRRAITDGIIGSNRVLAFLSKHSTRDPGVCRDEIAISVGVKHGNIQTILVESEAEVQPPVNISYIQWLDMHDWKERRATDGAAWDEWYKAKFAEIIRVVESDESRKFAGEIETLKAHLKPIDSDARIYNLLKKGFFGRQWVFDAVEKWRAAPQGDPCSTQRLFWITGDPGVGKSAFSAQLTLIRSDAIIASQFVEWDKPDHRDARRVVRSLAFQLATRLPDYRKLLLTLPEIAELDRKDPAELADYLLANPLCSAIVGGRERQLIVIDALDEADEAGCNPLVEMLARHAPRLPDWLGLVVTSRPESAVQTPLQGLNPFVLDTRTEANRADLRDYIRRQIAPQLHNRPAADRLIDQILEKSEGVFLYVERFCDDVQQNHLSLDRPEQFPQGLGGIFCQWFQRQFPDLEKFRKDARPALRAILAAREPLPVEILQRLFHLQNEELRDFTRTLGPLFPVTKEKNGEVIRPYHKSLADWLADETKAGMYFIDCVGGYRQLADAGFDYLSHISETFVSSAGSIFYARNTLYHFCVLKDWDKLVSCIAEPEVFQNLWPGSYGQNMFGLQFSDPAVLRNLWPRSRSFPSHDERITASTDLKPNVLDSIPAESSGKIAWALADAFAERTGEVQLRIFDMERAHRRGGNVMRNLLQGDAFIEYRDLVYGFVNLAGLAPAFAMSNCQFEQVGTHQGYPIFRPRDSVFQTRAREFLQRYQSIHGYLHYLAHNAANEGMSGLLESDACCPDEAWQLLATLADPQAASPQNFIKMSDLDYATAKQVDVESPWGAMQRKPAGVDAFLVADEQGDGEIRYHMVWMGSDGSPIAIQKDVKALGIDVARSYRWRSVLAGILSSIFE
jgi:hypothetical protein